VSLSSLYDDKASWVRALSRYSIGQAPRIIVCYCSLTKNGNVDFHVYQVVSPPQQSKMRYLMTKNSW